MGLGILGEKVQKYHFSNYLLKFISKSIVHSGEVISDDHKYLKKAFTEFNKLIEHFKKFFLYY